MTMKNLSEDGHYIIESKLLGKLKVRFGVYGDTISSARYLPWNGTGIDEIKRQLEKIKNANDELFIYMEDLNDKIVINGIPYNNFSFEVTKWNNINLQGLRVLSRGNRADKFYSTEITDAARKVVEKEINDIFNDIFEDMSNECRSYAIKNYKIKTQERLNDAKQNIADTESYLASLMEDDQ
tara:strand:- start:37 stop:582 length:546 start_codon:yes stop_codon:yes gene_type:complete